MENESPSGLSHVKQEISRKAQDCDQYFNLLVNHIADNVYEKVDRQNTRSRNRFAILASSITGLILLGVSSGVSTIWTLNKQSTETIARSAAVAEVPRLIEEIEYDLKQTTAELTESSLRTALKRVEDTGKESVDVMTIQVRALLLAAAESFSESDAKEINRLVLSFKENGRYKNHEFFPDALLKVVSSYIAADRIDLVLPLESSFRDVMLDHPDMSIAMVDGLGRDLAAVPVDVSNLSKTIELSSWNAKLAIYSQYKLVLENSHRYPEKPYLYDILIGCKRGYSDDDFKLLVRRAESFSDADLDGLYYMGEYIGGLVGMRYQAAKEEWMTCLEEALEHDSSKFALGTALVRFRQAAFGNFTNTALPE